MSTFLALLPTGPALSMLRAHPRAEPEGIRWEPEQRWHITIRYIPHTDAATRAVLTEAADEVTLKMAPPTITLGPATERLGRDGTLVVPATGADGVAAGVDEALNGTLGERELPFYGHLTLARRRRHGELTDELVGVGLETSFVAPVLYLIESSPGPEGSLYEVLHQAPFTAPSTEET